MLHAPVICHRLFFMLRPPIELARRITDAARWFEGGGFEGGGFEGVRGRLAPERLHVTIDILDDFADTGAMPTRQLLEIGAEVAAAPFAVTFDRVVASGHSIALRPSTQIPGLDALRAALLKAQTARGIAERDGYRFSAHMTLGYRKGAPFTERIAPVGWEVDAFELVHSHVGATRHDVLGRWALQGAEEAQLALF